MVRGVGEDQNARMVERYELYKAGLSDRAISQAQGVSRTSIQDWRLRNAFPVNNNANVPADAKLRNAGTLIQPPPGNCKISPERVKLRRELYDAGSTDSVIAEAVGIRPTNVILWRQREGLPPNFPPGRTMRTSEHLAFVTPDLKRRAVALSKRGVDVRTIARELATTVKSVEKWHTEALPDTPYVRQSGAARRSTPRHPSGRAYSKLRAERRARAFVLYADGLNDYEIAKDLGVNRGQVWEWRHALFLPSVGKAWRKHAVKPKPKPLAAAISPMSNPLYAHIVASIGRGIASDLVDDAVSDIWLALAEGQLSHDQISAQAGKFRNRVIGNYASKFGPRSLDEDIGDGNGFRMLDLLKDHSSSDWLEEMGATVW
jgi:transposase-like protein